MEDSSKQKKIFYYVGLLFVITGVLCNEWMLTYLFSHHASIALSKRIIIWIFDLAAIATGIIIIKKKKSLNLKILSYYFLMALIMIFAVEVVLNIAYKVIDPDPELQDKSYLLPVFKDKEWAKAIFQERHEMRIIHLPYRMWGNKEFHGKYINVNSQGFRETWNPLNSQGGGPKSIFMLGGSTTWSLGARDDYSVPSYVSKMLNEKGYNFKVYNYADFAYVNAQEIITLILLLREGYRPDYVIMYDGINDVYDAYQNGIPGALNNQFLISKRLEKLDMSNLGQLGVIFRNLLNKYSVIYKEWDKIMNKINAPELHFQEVAHSYDDDQLRKLAEDEGDYYLKSLNLLDNLSKAYNFKYMCFWQPNALTEDMLTHDESNTPDIKLRLQDQVLKKFYHYVPDYIRTKQPSHYYDISDALNGRTKSYYWDWTHLTEEGNEVIANIMVSKFEKEYLLK